MSSISGTEKAFSVKMSKRHWIFLKRYAMDHEMSMNQIIRDMIEKLVKKEEAKLK